MPIDVAFMRSLAIRLADSGTGARTLYRPSVRKRERAESRRQAFRAFRYLLTSLVGLITLVSPSGPGVTEPVGVTRLPQLLSFHDSVPKPALLSFQTNE